MNSCSQSKFCYPQSGQGVESIDERVEKCLKNSTIHEEFEVVIEGVSKKVKGHNVEKDCIVGAVIPTFEACDLDNNVVNTANLLGKVNVINFWFAQCKPCIKEMPFLNTLVDMYPDNNVSFIAFNRDDLVKTKSVLNTYEFKFQVIPDAESIIKKKFNMIWAYPFTVVIDKQNKVVGTFGAINNDIYKDHIFQLIEENL